MLMAGFTMAGVSIAMPGDTFPRYALGYTPFVILFMMRGAKRWGRAAWAYSLVALALVGGFGVLGRADYADHMQARYDAALWMEARTGQVDSVTYLISDLLADHVRVERRFPYACRLCGFTTRDVLAQARADMPPVPRDPPPGRPPPVIGPP